MRSVLQYARVSTCLSSHRILLIGLLLALPSVFSVAAATEPLNFIIKATVVNPSCSVVTEDLNQTINMPDIDTGQLESSGQTQPIFFTVRLEKCGSNTDAKLKFSSTTDNGKEYFYPTKSDRGFVLGFTDKDGVEIPLVTNKVCRCNRATIHCSLALRREEIAVLLYPGASRRWPPPPSHISNCCLYRSCSQWLVSNSKLVVGGSLPAALDVPLHLWVP